MFLVYCVFLFELGFRADFNFIGAPKMLQIGTLWRTKAKYKIGTICFAKPLVSPFSFLFSIRFGLIVPTTQNLVKKEKKKGKPVDLQNI